MATQTYTYTQLQTAFLGYTKPSLSGSTRVGVGYDYGCVALKITGTQAVINNISSGDTNNPLYVRVDGGEQVDTTGWTGGGTGDVTLFTGLSDTEHRVEIIVKEAYGYDYCGFPKTGTMLTVTGSAPSAAPLVSNTHQYFGMDTTNMVEYLGPYSSVPSELVPQTPLTFRNGSNNDSGFMFRAKISELHVLSKKDRIFFAIDGIIQDPEFDSIDTVTTKMKVSTLSTTLDDTEYHTYHIYSLKTQGDIISIIVSGSNVSFENITPKKAVLFGDSVVQGVEGNGLNEGLVNSASLGILAINSGLAGQTTQQIADRVITDINDLNSEVDWIFTAAGRNNSPDSTFVTSYINLFNNIISLNRHNILCRGVVIGVDAFDYDTKIQEAIAASDDPNRIYFVPVGSGNTAPNSLWPSISSPDDTHPNETGYRSMQTYILRDYPQHFSFDKVRGDWNDPKETLTGGLLYQTVNEGWIKDGKFSLNWVDGGVKVIKAFNRLDNTIVYKIA
jgi:lysophospholipase L1-like esterase